ncbi:MAG: rRNA pseudouridine synthase [Phycisphaerales bacterium]|nr:rRNA pseudouridine synthase [Phycisphaerales bacterium]
MARRPPKPSSDLRDASRGERIQLVLAKAGVGSRRACEKLVQEGRVKVNGVVVEELPAWVDPANDKITVAGKRIETAERHVYVMLNKPRNTVSTQSDPDGRRTVSDLVKHPSGARLYPVGRLDYDTLGLLLLTNDGELANKLTHPKFGVDKIYRAVVRGALDDEGIERIKRGIVLATRKAGKTVGAERLGAVQLRVHRREPTRTVLDLKLEEGRNRQVRRILAAVGCPVKKLTRIQVGPIELKGVALGQWRELTATEIRALRKAVGEGAGAAKRAKKAASKSRAAKKPAARGAKSTQKRSVRITSSHGPDRSRRTR